jgi:hypothetical protein
MRLQWKRLGRNWPFFGERRQLLLSQKKIPQQHILHYLDDFIFALPVPEITPAKIKAFDKAYDEVTDALGIPRAEKKVTTGTCITGLGIEIYSPNDCTYSL